MESVIWGFMLEWIQEFVDNTKRGFDFLWIHLEVDSMIWGFSLERIPSFVDSHLWIRKVGIREKWILSDSHSNQFEYSSSNFKASLCLFSQACTALVECAFLQEFFC